MIIIPNLPAERDRRVIRECLTLEENGYEVTVIAPRGKPGLRVLPGSRNTRLKPYPVYLNGSGVLTFAAEFLWSFFWVAFRLLGEVLRGRAHAVQVCNPPDVYWPLALFFRALGRPWVFDHHDLSPEVYATRSDGAPNPVVFRVLTAMEWLTLRTASAVVATNESFRENALRRGLSPQKVTVVRNGPSAREIAPAAPVAAPDGIHRIVYLGVLGKQDNVAAVVYAAEELVRRRPARDWQVVIAGDGETLGELKELAVARGVADRVEFTGWLSGEEVDALLQTATVGVQPDLPARMNHLSTMAKSVEYVSRGVPVIAVDLVETRRTAGDAAVYVETGAPSEFAVAIDTLLDDPERRATMQAIALDRFETELSWEHQSVRYATMWHRLLPGRWADNLPQAVATPRLSARSGLPGEGPSLADPRRALPSASTSRTDRTAARSTGGSRSPAEKPASQSSGTSGSQAAQIIERVVVEPAPPASSPDLDPPRFLLGDLPSRIEVLVEFSVIVRITADPPPENAPAVALHALLTGPDGVNVTVIAQADSGLIGYGDLQQVIHVPRVGDSSPARFSFRSRDVGLRKLQVTAWIGGTFLGELALEVSAEPGRTPADSQRRKAPLGSLDAEPGEVTMQVRFDGAHYSFQLLSAQYLFEPVIARSLTDAPDTAVERTVEMLRRLANRSAGYSDSAARRWVRETGVGLWHDMVPDRIQDQFWNLRDQVSSFTIACADDMMPWELLYPLSATEDHGFLVQQFPVLRRVFGQRRVSTMSLGPARYVIPPNSPSNAHDEMTKVQQVLGSTDAKAPISDLDQLMDILDDAQAGLLHFACHNTFSLDEGGSSITMNGGQFVPLMLNSAVTRRSLADRRPLVFLNACRSAGVAPEYTSVMGWAGQFMAAGASAFVGTLWPVRSSRAADFAATFYESLVDGHDLGTATLRARRSTEDVADPTWLAYSIYGDPSATSTE